MTFTVRDIFDTSVDRYWGSIFFDPEYNARLYREGLGFAGFELIELTGEPGGRRTRTMRTEPSAEAPAVVRKLIGDSLSYTETGEWDPETRVWTYRIVPSRLPEKVYIGGRLWAEPEGEGRCARVAEVEVRVKVLGVGGTIEKFIERTTRESYVKATRFTNAYIAEKGL